MDFTTRLKLAIYETIATTAHVPTSNDAARVLSAPVADVENAFAALHRMRLLVPEPGARSRTSRPAPGEMTGIFSRAGLTGPF